MPRDINDVYTLPAGNPVVPGTVISTTWANATLNDIASALTASITQTAADARYANLTGDTFTGGVTVPSLNGGQLAGLRNKIINGNFGVNQRVVSGTVVLSAGQYGHDRWKAGSSGCTYTFASTAGVTTLTITAGSLQQPIEGANLLSGIHTLSWSGTAQGKIGTGSYSSSGVTGSVTGGSNPTIEFNTGTLSLVQFEPGAIATPFEHRLYGVELTLCQRYACDIVNGGSGQPVCGVGFTTSTTVAHGAFRFPVKMRSAPSFAILNDSAASFAVLGAGGADIALSALTVDQVGVDGCRVIATTSVALTQGYASVLRAATFPVAIFSAEL